ncbi:GspE/PulE family protein [Dactylococcopsis salina]|uniref:Type II secretory pathway, ATPase PulE/Tfp pilus assembly pathway, ATPase PilB n=1 Tax=Dactylococcopsis salina (strain PCC 8305) TaxID=13035 RepID=K9YU62_DACS8|nr:GspE/PulE family protein [Dactylococcopsis salina]AFZ49885.1 type II secretory pathway, ATPase PulE/Tfp pilus assembly pathway, ATPase PilB [Dactylococcopsis salina PCC 8305]
MTYSSSAKKRQRALTTLRDSSPFGSKLIQAGYADSKQIQEARQEVSQSEGKRSFTEALQSVTGKELPPELYRQYKKHHLFELKIYYGVESLDPEVTNLDQYPIKELIDDVIPVDMCRRYKLLPLDKKDTRPPSLLVGMVNPDQLDAQDNLMRILRPKQLKLQRIVMTLEDYQRIIGEYLDEQSAQEEEQAADEQLDVTKDLANLDVDGLEEVNDEAEADLEKSLGDAQAAPIINVVNRILIKALRDGASDIHIEPQEEYIRVRMRRDGVLQKAFDNLPIKIAPAIAARFKIIADLDIAERRMPQDGKIRRRYQGRNVDFRMSTLPSRYGEKVVLRILDNSATQLGLDKLITDAESLEVVREMASRPFGLILVTGPTGSGKSTTLYSILAERNDPGVNISTAEDPIEYSLPGITQVQVIREKGMDFASILRSFLRQDPDVILVGETRDKETAKTAIEAALTGHLVLTTLHTNDAAGAIARLDEMGVEPFMISGSLIGVLAQRLMRRVCSECRIPYNPTQEELARFGLSATKEEEITFHKANCLQPEEIEEARKKGKLCSKCGGNGYKGRAGVYEIMQMTETLQTLINEGAPTERIKEAGVEEGMKTLLAYSLNLVREGYTTLEEVERVTFTDSGVEAEMKAKRKSSLTCSTCGAELQQEWLDCPYCLTPRFQD